MLVEAVGRAVVDSVPGSFARLHFPEQNSQDDEKTRSSAQTCRDEDDEVVVVTLCGGGWCNRDDMSEISETLVLVPGVVDDVIARFFRRVKKPCFIRDVRVLSSGWRQQCGRVGEEFRVDLPHESP